MAVSEKFINRLNDLLMLDHDAVDAYQQAIDRISSNVCRERLLSFQNDHRRHIADLEVYIRNLGATPQSRRDIKGFFIKGMTAVQSMVGDEMALKAMQTNEKLTNRQYQDAVDDQSMPEDAHALILKNREDERRHLEWINMALTTRIWEQAPGVQP